MNPLVMLALQETPALISAFKSLFGKQNPGAPEPTDEEVIAAYQEALQSSLDKDANWLSMHGG
jgi:hypothetical protein